jgi:hypothetical protein
VFEAGWGIECGKKRGFSGGFATPSSKLPAKPNRAQNVYERRGAHPGHKGWDGPLLGRSGDGGGDACEMRKGFREEGLG